MTGRDRSRRVLYIAYWGALEPLGQSLVVPAVLRLAQLDISLTLITFEKPSDFANAAAVSKQRETFAAGGVSWHPLIYHKTPKWPATALDGVLAVLKALRLRLRGRFDVIHARTFVAGPMGYAIARLLGIRFVYHNEGFYPDEQVDGGVWKDGAFVHRLARRVEAFLYDHADGLIALSSRAREVLLARPRVYRAKTPVIVVPSAVDLTAFRPPLGAHEHASAISLVYLGSVGLRYRLDDAGRFVAAMQRIRPETTLTVVSRADRNLVASMLDSSGLPREVWTLKELAHSDVPTELHRHHAGLFFLVEGLSAHGCSPTKIGEYWACGLPVATTPNVSDTSEIVRNQRVGVVVRSREPDSFDRAASELVDLLADQELQKRCREAAENTYSLDAACVRQRELYAALISG